MNSSEGSSLLGLALFRAGCNASEACRSGLSSCLIRSCVEFCCRAVCGALCEITALLGRVGSKRVLGALLRFIGYLHKIKWLTVEIDVLVDQCSGVLLL